MVASAVAFTLQGYLLPILVTDTLVTDTLVVGLPPMKQYCPFVNRREGTKTMTLLRNAAVLGFLCAATLMGAANPIIGTWKLNSAKTKTSPGPPPNAVTAVYTQEGDWIIGKYAGVDAAGRPFNSTHRYKQDGKKYPSQWGAQGRRGTLSVRKIDDHTAEVVLKFEDGGTVTRRRVISDDGNTMTFTDSGANAKGETINSIMVWERQ